MKILYAGNLVNVGYSHTSLCREKGLDMELLMQKNPEPNSDPFQYVPDLNEYPSWIKFYDRQKSLWQLNVVKMMRNSKYQLIHSHVELPIFARFSGKKFIAHTLGSDLKEMAFSNSLRGFLLRQAYNKANLVIYSTPDQSPMLDKLKIHHRLFLPLLRDLRLFKKIQITTNDLSNNFLIFHPTSHIWKSKGNDILIRAFEKFVKFHPNSYLIMIDKGIDSKKSKQLVKNLKIENKIKFLSRLNSSDLVKYYNLADVVADQFIEPGLGGIGMETLSCEKPLLNFCPNNCYQGMYDEPPPVVHAETSDDIYQQLITLLDEQTRKDIGNNGIKWIDKNMSSQILIKKYHFLYNSIVDKVPFKTIMEKLKTNF